MGKTVAPTLPRPRSTATKALIQEKALAQGLQRTEAVVSAVRSAMATIEAEIAANDGIYPGNKGALSLNEVARRASVHSTTLFGPKYKALKSDVDEWLRTVKSKAVTGRMRVRKEMTERVGAWRELYEALLESHHISELDLQEAQHQLEVAQAEVARLRDENAKLTALLSANSANKVVSLRRPKD